MVVVLQRAALSAVHRPRSKVALQFQHESALPRGFVASANVTTIHYERLKQNAGLSLSRNRKHFLSGVSGCKIEPEKNTYLRNLMKLTVQLSEIYTHLNALNTSNVFYFLFPVSHGCRNNDFEK